MFWGIVIAFFIGMWAGLLVFAICHVNRREEEYAERRFFARRAVEQYVHEYIHRVELAERGGLATVDDCKRLAKDLFADVYNVKGEQD